MSDNRTDVLTGNFIESDQDLAGMNRILRTLSAGNRALISCKNEPDLLRTICNVLVNVGEYAFAWIDLALCNRNTASRFKCRAGDDKGFISLLPESWSERDYHAHPMAETLHSGRTTLHCFSVSSIPLNAWMYEACRRGFKALACLPLFENEHPIGALCIASGHSGFKQNEIDLLEELAADVSFGIKVYRTRSENTMIQNSLISSEEKYRTLTENISAGIFRVSSEGRFMEVNKFLVDMLGYSSRESVLSIKVNKIFSNTGALRSIYKELRKKGIVKNREIELKQNKEAQVWLSVTITAVFDDNGRVQFFDGIVEDITDRKQMELEIIRRKQYFKSIFESAPVAIVTLDANREIKNWNKGAEAIFGYESSEVAGKALDSLISGPCYEKQAKQMTEAVLSGKHLIAREVVRFRKDGTPVQVIASGSPIYINGDLHGIVVVYEDISEYKKIQTKLQESEQRYRLIAESTSDIIWILDCDLVPCYVSPSVYQQTGYAVSEILSMDFSDILTSCSMKLLADFVASEMRTEHYNPDDALKSKTVELELIKKDSDICWMENKFTSIFNDKGERIGIHVISRDITLRKAADEELRRLNRALKTLSEGNKALVRAADENTLVKDMCRILVHFGGYNTAWINLYNETDALEPAAIQVSQENKIALDQLKGCINIAFMNYSLQAVKTSQPLILTHEKLEALQHLSGGFVSLHLPLSQDSAVFGVLNIISAERSVFDKDEIALLEEMANDLSFGIYVLRERLRQKETEQEKIAMQRQLLQAQKMEAIGVLTGGIAHDFNNLLTAIIGCSDMAMMDIEKDNPVYSELEDIRTAANRAADLTSQLLIFSRKQPMKFEPVRLNLAIRNLLNILRRVIGENIIVHTDFEPDLWTVCADKGTMEQVIMNLAVNARDAMTDGGILKFEARNLMLDKQMSNHFPGAKPGKYVLLSVEDSGIGMDSETVQHIFEPFFSTKGEKKGTGLGLSVVYGIINQHGGWISVKSEKNKGTTFSIYLPAIVKPIPRERALAVKTSKHDGQGRKVLIIEDEDRVREFTINGLKRSGYKVYSACDAKEARKVFNEQNGDFDFVMSDIGLPGISGLDLVQEFKGLKPELKILLSSGYTDHMSRWPVIQEKGFKFLEKPYALNDLLHLINGMNA